jgi:hypothetical protein
VSLSLGSRWLTIHPFGTAALLFDPNIYIYIYIYINDSKYKPAPKGSGGGTSNTGEESCVCLYLYCTPSCFYSRMYGGGRLLWISGPDLWRVSLILLSCFIVVLCCMVWSVVWSVV